MKQQDSFVSNCINGAKLKIVKYGSTERDTAMMRAVLSHRDNGESAESLVSYK